MGFFPTGHVLSGIRGGGGRTVSGCILTRDADTKSSTFIFNQKRLRETCVLKLEFYNKLTTFILIQNMASLVNMTIGNDII